MLIREARADDWPRIWPFFRSIVEAGETYAYPDGMTSAQANELWMVPEGVVLVAVTDDGTVLGSARSGPNRPGRGRHVATAAFMVSPAARGRGVGRALAERVLTWASDAGYRSMQFNAVVETNTAAVRLWEDLGFRIVGTVPAAFDSRSHGLVALHVMYRELAPSR